MRKDLDRTRQGQPVTREARHERAVARTLEFAEEAASRGDFSEALAWLETLDAIGRRLPSEYASKRLEWRLAVADQRSQRPAPSRRPGR
jgi:hypothetical protein